MFLTRLLPVLFDNRVKELEHVVTCLHEYGVVAVFPVNQLKLELITLT